MRLRKLPVVFIALVAFYVPAMSQSTASSAELRGILQKAERATRQYTEVFKNLTAEEIKTFEDFDKKGKIRETRRIASDFIVYQSSDGTGVNEFRKVKSFNGQGIVQTDSKIEELFQKLTDAGSSVEEGKMLKKEALRFDGRSSAWGVTLWQESPFGNVKSFFKFEIVGREKIEGRDSLIVAYQQVKPTPLLKFNPTAKDWKKEPAGRDYSAPISSNLRPANAEQSGRIWLDAENGQIWRNELKITLHPPQLSQPVVGLELNYEYQKSPFKILVPKKFTYTFYKITGSGANDLSVLKDRTMTFEYSNFSEFKTETREYKLSDKN